MYGYQINGYKIYGYQINYKRLYIATASIMSGGSDIKQSKQSILKFLKPDSDKVDSLKLTGEQPPGGWSYILKD